jgi:hypothetical protein
VTWVTRPSRYEPAMPKAIRSPRRFRLRGRASSLSNTAALDEKRLSPGVAATEYRAFEWKPGVASPRLPLLRCDQWCRPQLTISAGVLPLSLPPSAPMQNPGKRKPLLAGHTSLGGKSTAPRSSSAPAAEPGLAPPTAASGSVRAQRQGDLLASPVKATHHSPLANPKGPSSLGVAEPRDVDRSNNLAVVDR